MCFNMIFMKKMKFVISSCTIIFCSFMMIPTDVLSKKLEIIIGGSNYCKTTDDCEAGSFCHDTTHVCISCSNPFEWSGTECKCPEGTVLNADGSDCLECIIDDDCSGLKECNMETNTCGCPAGLHEEDGVCVCTDKNKTVNEDGNCVCNVTEESCQTSDVNIIDCTCCPDKTPIWDEVACKTCAEIDPSKPYYNLDKKTCEECLKNADCKNEQICSDDKTCICELTPEKCLTSDFMGADMCSCCPDETPMWDEQNKQCVELSCYRRMIMAGFSDTYFTATDSSITYNGDMVVGKDLDISMCDLRVNGELIINSGVTSVRNVEVINSDKDRGITLYENTTLNAAGNITSTMENVTGTAKGIKVSVGATITAKGNIIASIASTSTDQLSGISSSGTITAQGAITGTATNRSDDQLYGISVSSGTITAQEAITGTATSEGGNQLHGIHALTDVTIKAEKGDIIGQAISTDGGTQNEGISSSGTLIAQGNITGTATSSYGGQLRGIASDGTLTAKTGAITGTATSEYGGQLHGISSSGTITAQEAITGTATSEWGDQLSGISSEGTMTAQGTITGTATSSGIQLSGILSSGTMTAGENIVAFASKTSQSDDISVLSESTMTAKNVYYCNTIYGEVKGKIIQKCP
ncbi:MAG: hypothetical protein IKV03_00670 [Alphaproteobacteria bacterium]|nr:hypothetical protein [Alphaproteobacteria bacterium]